MITLIKDWKQYNENILSETILVPRNLDSRKDKLKHYNIELLSQEVIKGGLDIDETFLDIPKELVKVKEIIGHVNLYAYKGYIPEWLKDIKIDGYFDCGANDLTSLENCPQIVKSNFYCENNKLTSLKGCPKYVGGNFYCTDNQLISLEDCPEYIGGNFYCTDNRFLLQLPKQVKLKGDFYN